VSLVLAPSHEGEFLGILLMKFWVIFVHFTGNDFLVKRVSSLVSVSAGFGVIIIIIIIT